jgi:hypothetical protein
MVQVHRPRPPHKDVPPMLADIVERQRNEEEKTR